MNVIETSLPGVLIVEPAIHGDARGFLVETYNQARYRQAGVDAKFVQTNLSRSAQGVLRGLHYQIRRPQGKLVSVLRGEVFDVAVDVRLGSPSFGQWLGTRLSGDNHRQLYVPAGFAHGFCVLSDFADFTYQCTTFYDPEDEGGVFWSDPALGIAWPLKTPQLSDRDAALPVLEKLRPDQLPSYKKTSRKP